MRQWNVACVQVNAQDAMEENLRQAEKGIREAAARGATCITLPENAFAMVATGTPYPDAAPALALCARLARELNAVILAGSVMVPATGGHYWNRSVLFAPSGDCVCHYNKIHRFDATLPSGETYRESARIAAGDEAVVAHCQGWGIGLSICYDVRFPGLYRALAQAGAAMLFVPAAFTYTTGTAHWHVLLRARAIETGCYVVAPAQCGAHPGNRRTYGHSLIIDPWGRILAEGAEDEPGVIFATLDRKEVEQARSMIPSLQHGREFTLAP